MHGLRGAAADRSGDGDTVWMCVCVCVSVCVCVGVCRDGGMGGGRRGWGRGHGYTRCFNEHSTQWATHDQSLRLEQETGKKITMRVEDKVSKGSGTWIDWQCVIDAMKLLRKVSGVEGWSV